MNIQSVLAVLEYEPDYKYAIEHKNIERMQEALRLCGLDSSKANARFILEYVGQEKGDCFD